MKFIRERINKLAAELMIKSNRRALCAWIIENSIWLVVLGALAGFLVLAEDVWNKDIMDGDQMGYAIISSLSVIPGMNDFARAVTHLGDPATYIVMVLIMMILFRKHHITRVIILNIINVGLLNLMLKYILQRPRPLGPHLVSASGFSFPSGHAMGSLAFYGLFMYLIYLYVPNRKAPLGRDAAYGHHHRMYRHEPDLSGRSLHQRCIGRIFHFPGLSDSLYPYYPSLL